MKQSVQVMIQGQEFSLKTDLPAEKVQKVADFVNEQIDKISGPEQTVDSFRAVVLVLLNVAGLYLNQDSDTCSEESAIPDQQGMERLEQLAMRIEDALRDPQGDLGF